MCLKSAFEDINRMESLINVMPLFCFVAETWQLPNAVSQNTSADMGGDPA